MYWRVTLTSNFGNHEVTYQDFEDRLAAIGFLMKSFFLGNYHKIQIEYVPK